MTPSAGRSRPRTCASAWPAPAAPTTSTASTATTSRTTCSTSAAICRRPTSARIENCPDFRRAVNAGDYDYLITTPELDLNNPVQRQPLAGAGLGQERSGRPGGCAFGARLGVPDHGRALARGLRRGQPARRRGSTGRIGYDQAVSGIGDYILGVLGLVAVVLSMAIAGRTTRRAALPSLDRTPCSARRHGPRDRHPDRGRGAARSLRRTGRGAPGRGQPDRRWLRAAARADADPRRRPRRPLGSLRGAGPAPGAGRRPDRDRRGGHPRPDRRGAVGGPDAPGARPWHLRRRLALVPHAARCPHR